MRLLSTKKLQENQRELLLNAGASFVEYDAITIHKVPFEIPKGIENIVITSQNGAKAFLKKYQESLPFSDNEKQEVRCFVVGIKTKKLLSEKGLKVSKIARNGAELARFVAKQHKNEQFHYFCGNRRRDEMPAILKQFGVALVETIVYETTLNIKTFEQPFDGVLFFSPSSVAAFEKANSLKNTQAFCIGATTAATAKKYTDQVIVSNSTTIESTIAKAVNVLKN